MGGKYEVRYWLNNPKVNNDLSFQGYETIYTNSWFEYMKLRITKRIIYYKVCV